jgi:hypothetical protein
LSASAIGRLKDGWLDEHTAWQKRDLSAKRYVYTAAGAAFGFFAFKVAFSFPHYLTGGTGG